MLRTEEEAKKCWCPFTRIPADDRVSLPGNAAINRGPPGSEAEKRTRCIASECMAWRALPERKRLFVTRFGDEEAEYQWDPRNSQSDPNIREQYAAATYREVVERHGFCGLAGKPA